MFGIRRLPDWAGVCDVVRINETISNQLEGAEVFDTLCPVSKLTGFRENPLSLLAKQLDPAKVRLVNAVLQELPVVANEDGRISDSDALDMIVDRLSSGTPAEDALIRSKLSDMLDVLIPQNMRQEVEQKIQFAEGDAHQIDTSDVNS